MKHSSTGVFLCFMNFPLKALLLPILLIVFFSCKKESFTNSADAILRATEDTLKFDTVFTTTGSVSQFVKIINPNDKGIRVSSVRLAGGAASPYKINVDGIPGPQVNNLEVAAGDSLYIYVTVAIDPTAANLPFVVSDSIEVDYNSNKLWVQLQAFGQNAHFYRNKIITSSESWNDDLPIVVLDRLTIQPNATLTINQGTRIYIHADAPVLVNGTLNILGQAANRVIFSGDRLDEPYKNFPASYPGIIFTETSTNNFIRYAIIKNAYQGLVVINPSAGTKLELQETIIDNAYDAGLLGLNTSIKARNLLISNCGKNLVLVKGGDYLFEHCTLAAYSTDYLQHREPVLFLSNYIVQNNVPSIANLNAIFRNSVFWGESGGFVSNEVSVNKQGNSVFNVSFENVLWKVPANPANSIVTGVNLMNVNPVFDSISTGQNIFSFRPGNNSPLIDKASASGINLDLDGKPRPVPVLPDLGAYEKQ
jgi:hypothetical protein